MRKILLAILGLALAVSVAQAAPDDSAVVDLVVQQYCRLDMNGTFQIHITGTDYVDTSLPTVYKTQHIWAAQGASNPVSFDAWANFPYKITGSPITPPTIVVGGVTQTAPTTWVWDWSFNDGTKLLNQSACAGQTGSATITVRNVTLRDGCGNWTGGSITFTIAHQ